VAVDSFKAALMHDCIPVTSFRVDDVHAEVERRRALGVRFTQEPTKAGDTTTAVLDDTCGNLIQIHGRAERNAPEPRLDGHAVKIESGSGVATAHDTYSRQRRGRVPN
jgi:hypothetical protein